MPKDVTLFAETTFRNSNRRFGIKTDDRRRHMYLIGKTGMGKSTVLENMIIEDIRNGNGLALVDPHGDLAEKVIKFVPNERINDVVYFNPADFEYPIAFNVLEQVESHQRHLVASGLIGVFQKLWADSWGPRLEYILRNTILAILDYPGSTLLGVTRMLSDKPFRNKIIEKIEDPVVKAFWVKEFAGYADKFASEAVSPIQNKVGQFLSTSLIRNIVGQPKSTIDMRKIMDEGKILILNMSKGRIGEDSSQLLGAMMITKIQLAAMSRVDTPEDERKDFYLYIDEFQNFTTDSFANILSEARKYKLNLIMAHQYIEQLGDVVKYAVFGNVGTLVVFRVGATDAEALEPEFTPTFDAEDIVNLPKYEFYLKLMIDGIASEPFSARGLLPYSKEFETGNEEKIIAVSRERYARDRASVQDKIAKWHESMDDAPASDSRSSKKKKPEELDPNVYKYSAECTSCGKETKLSFEPDGVRPVFCKDCLSKTKEERDKEMAERKKLKQQELAQIKQVEEVKKKNATPSVDRTGGQIRTQDAVTKQKDATRSYQRPTPPPIRKAAPTSQVSAGNARPAKDNKIDNAQSRDTGESAGSEGISLDQMMNMQPVNFKGKVIENNKKVEKEEQRESPPILKTEKTDTSKSTPAQVKKEFLSEEQTKPGPATHEDDFDEFELDPDRSVDL